MTKALEAAAETAVAKKQSMRIEDHFTPDEQQMIRAWGALVLKMSTMDPKSLPRHFRKLRLGTITSKQPAG